MSYNIIGLGEVLWDLLPSGPQMGGAPANFVYHAHSLGACARVITRVGNDRHGDELRSRFTAMNLSTDWVQIDASAPTGTVTVTLSGSGIPEYTIHEGVAWDQIAVTPAALALVREADVICFGTLAQRSPASRDSIQRLVAATPTTAWRILDINLRQNFYDRETIETSLNQANVLKLNNSELPVLARMFGASGDLPQQLEFFARRFDLRVVALTRGCDGSILYQEGAVSEQTSVKVAVKDTVGAGDSFTAALCIGLLTGMNLENINSAANQVASFVCGSSGATPALPADLRQLFVLPSANTVLAQSSKVATAVQVAESSEFVD